MKLVRWRNAALATIAGVGLAAGCDWWTVWDAPFYRDSWDLALRTGWKGGDGIMSVPLGAAGGNNLTLWLYGDTFVYNTWGSPVKINQVAGGLEFTQLFSPRNTVAMQAVPTSQSVWTPPTSSQINFYATDSTNNGFTIKTLTTIGSTGNPPQSKAYSYAPRSSYPQPPPEPSENKQWKWPADGVVHTSSQLNIFWQQTKETEDDCFILFGGFAILALEFDDTYIERIRTPTAAPDAWTFGDVIGGTASSPTRFKKMNVPRYMSPVGELPVAVWGAAILKDPNLAPYTYIYGHTMLEQQNECHSCTDPNNPQTCTPNSVVTPVTLPNDVVLARVSSTGDIRNSADWQYWWNDVVGHNCAGGDIVEGCSGTSGANCVSGASTPFLNNRVGEPILPA